MSKLYGDEKPDPEALTQMQSRGGTWAAYQNHEIGHPDCGNLRFLKIGPGCTFENAPPVYPDTKHGIGWRYLYVGRVDLETGEILETEPRLPNGERV